eukprot:scaffold1159_cov19-Tisochrysis_lutea.AAC.1
MGGKQKEQRGLSLLLDLILEFFVITVCPDQESARFEDGGQQRNQGICDPAPFYVKDKLSQSNPVPQRPPHR